MTLQTEKFIRKVRPVEAVKVTEDNLSEVAGWCRGLVVPAGAIGDDPQTYIHVPVRNARRESDTKAYVGYWIVKEDYQNCRVITNKQFKNSYDPLEKAKSPAPKPSAMPQKVVPTPKQVGAVEVVPGTPPEEGSSLTTGKVHRDAESGEFVTEEYADANPATTVAETIEINEESEVKDEAAAATMGVTPDHPDVPELEETEEPLVASDSMNAGDLVADDLAADIAPGDMVDPNQPEQDEDGTVQLGAPTDELVDVVLCGSCGSEVIDGVCSKDIEHDVHGTADSAPVIHPPKDDER